jgi:hypothetical protein
MEEAVNLPCVVDNLRRDVRGLEEPAVFFSLATKDVVFGGKNEGGRQPGKRVSTEW